MKHHYLRISIIYHQKKISYMHASTISGSALDRYSPIFPTPYISPDAGSLMASSDKTCTMHALANKKDKLLQSFDLNDPSQFIRLSHCGQQIGWQENPSTISNVVCGSRMVHPAQINVNVHIKG